jgi:hypothetical protein
MSAPSYSDKSCMWALELAATANRPSSGIVETEDQGVYVVFGPELDWARVSRKLEVAGIDSLGVGCSRFPNGTFAILVRADDARELECVRNAAVA